MVLQMNNLETSEWKYFKLIDLFRIERARNVKSEDAKEEEGKIVPYIVRSSLNNGLSFHVKENKFPVEKGNCITIAGEGASIFYQDRDFISGNNIHKLYSNFLNENIGLFIVSILNLEKYRYSYNRAFNKSCLEKTNIKLPVNKDGNPDWSYMENYIIKLREREREFWACSKINRK